jgi:ribonuclease R
MLQIEEHEEELFIRRIRAMERDGQIMRNRKRAICVMEKLDLVKGKVQGHPDGFGFLIPEDGSDDLVLSAKEMHKVLHGDVVMARIGGIDRRGRREASVVEVLVHANTLWSDAWRRSRHPVCGGGEPPHQPDILVAPGEQGVAVVGQVVILRLCSSQASMRSLSAASSKCWATMAMPVWKSRLHCASMTCPMSFRMTQNIRPSSFLELVLPESMRGARMCATCRW